MKYGRQLIHAISKGDTEKFDEIMGKIEGVNYTLDPVGNKQTSPLIAAVWHENSYMVERLLAAGADPNGRDAGGAVPIDSAKLNVPLTRQLLDAGAHASFEELDVHPRYWDSFIESGLVEAFVDHGASPNWQDEDGNTLLSWVRQPSSVETLVEMGADPTIRNNSGQTPYEFQRDSAWFSEPLPALKQAEDERRAADSKSALIDGLSHAWKPSDCKEDTQDQKQEERLKRQRKM